MRSKALPLVLRLTAPLLIGLLPLPRSGIASAADLLPRVVQAAGLPSRIAPAAGPPSRAAPAADPAFHVAPTAELPSRVTHPAQPPSRPTQTVDLHRGIAITNWFRFPASRAPAALASYLPDSALKALHDAGFDFVRLAIDPTIIDNPITLTHAIQRIQRAGLTVVVSPHPTIWHLETSQPDRNALRAFWQTLAPALAKLDQTRIVPEILNEPVFANDPATWATLQHQILTDLRRALPQATIILTGQDWGSINGLLHLQPEADPNVLYSFHFYDPAELTSLAPWRHDVDRSALTRLPFPVTKPCELPQTDPTTQDLIRYYCALNWTPARLSAEINQAVAWATANHAHLFAGEFGASAELNPQARLAWITAVRTILEADHVPWSLWGYDDVMGFDVARPPGAHPHLDPALLTALGLSTSL